MKKDMIRGIVSLTVLLALFFVLVAVIPFARVAEVTIGIGFALAAFAVASAAVYIAFIKNPNARSRFYGFPIARLGLVYLAVQVVLSFICMAVGAYIPWWISVAVFSVLLAAAVLGLISAEAVVEEIRTLDGKLEKNVARMRQLQSKVNRMADQCDDPDGAEAVRCFAEEMRYSDPVSSEALAGIEEKLADAVEELQSVIADGDSAAIKGLCRKATALLAERNRLCKLNK